MPFENIPVPPRRIAVIGAGISGLGVAHLLSQSHRVVLFEAEPRLGGHARTVLAGKRGDQPVDTGFIVFNRPNYPLMSRLFDHLGVPVARSNMSFGASIRQGWLEYSLENLPAMFAQRRNLVRPGYIAMLLDVMRFNNNAVHAATDPETTLGELFDQLRLGRWFRDYYFLPISGAIWSTATERMNQFPAQSLVRFFQNHALLSATGQHQWYTVQGGSIEYVRRLEAAIRSAGAEVRAGSPVAGVRRLATGAEVRVTGGAWEHFDDVVFATHSDVTLRLLADPSADERQALGAIRYQPNIAVLHRDADQMPRNRGCWASWVYKDDGAAPAERIPLTYWMNSLQPIPQDDPLFVTLNPGRPIPDEAVFDVTTFQHPVYDLAAQAAQRALRAMQGRNRTWFCGAYLRHGFHEDGYASAVEVAGMLGTVPAWA